MSNIAEPKITQTIKPLTDIPEPHQYHVVYFNDNVTTIEFVIETLVIIFDHDHLSANSITEKIQSIFF
mgnify:CR=1 FL=1